MKGPFQLSLIVVVNRQAYLSGALSRCCPKKIWPHCKIILFQEKTPACLTVAKLFSLVRILEPGANIGLPANIRLCRKCLIGTKPQAELYMTAFPAYTGE
jgi:hypothetical protein